MKRAVSLNPDKNPCAGRTIAELDKKSSGRRLSSRLKRTVGVTESGARYERISLKNGQKNGRAVYYIHGGAFYAGLNPFYRELAYDLCGCMGGGEVIFVDYTTVPTAKYPTQLEETLDVWYELTERLGYKPENVTVGGDSAGGGLALAMLLSLRDSGRAMPRSVFGISPWTDMTASGDSYIKNYRLDAMFGDRKSSASEKKRRALTESELFGYARGLTDKERKSPLVSPVFGDFHGFPPAFFTVGEHEMLLSDTLIVAESMKKNGVSVSVDTGAGMFHIYTLFGRYIPEAKRSYKRLLNFISQGWDSADCTKK